MGGRATGQSTEMGELPPHDPYLTGQCLIAMPNMPDERFERSVIYMCSHTDEGALGLIVNKTIDTFTFSELCEKLEISAEPAVPVEAPVYFGGPVETSRGFVLHTADYTQADSTLWVSEEVGLTATLDVVRAIAEGAPIDKYLLALGYAGWGPGQLEAEIQGNGWLHCPADQSLLFGDEREATWANALGRIGIRPELLSAEAGHA